MLPLDARRKFCMQVMSQLKVGDKGALYSSIMRLLTHSPEVQAQTLPDLDLFSSFVQHGLAIYGGNTKFLDTFGLLRGRKENQDIPKSTFSDTAGLWKEWEQYRLRQVSPNDLAYMQLLQDGEGVAPGPLVALPEQGGKSWQKGVCTVMLTLPEKTNAKQPKAIRLAYDNEDIPPYLALATLALCGYSMNSDITSRIHSFSHAFAKTGSNLYDEALRLTKNVRYQEMYLDDAALEQFISENRHPFYNERELGL